MFSLFTANQEKRANPTIKGEAKQIVHTHKQKPTFSFAIKGKTKMFKPLDEADEVQECVR